MLEEDKGMVSVVIPMYNSEAYIAECIESVLCQTYYNLQIIVVDDGSLDKSKLEIEKFEDPRLEYYFQQNQGVSAARNLGLSKVKGDWIVFVDSDDVLSSMAIENMLQVSGQKIIVVASECGDKKLLDDIADENVLIDRIHHYPQKQNSILYNRDMYTVWGKLYDARLVRDSNVKFCVGLAYGEDTLFNIELLSVMQCKVIHISNKIYFYRGKDTIGLKSQYIMEYIKQCNEYCSFAIKENCFNDTTYVKLLVQSTHIIISEDLRTKVGIRNSFNNVQKFIEKTNFNKMKKSVVDNVYLKRWTDRVSWFFLKKNYLVLYVLIGRFISLFVQKIRN